MFIKKKGQISIEALIIVSVLIVGGIIFATVYLGQRNKLVQDQSRVLGTIDNIDYSGDFETITNPPTSPEPPNPNECSPYPEHCCNNIPDYDEDGLDCGGSDCTPCGTPEYGCENLGEPTFSPEGGVFSETVNLNLNYIDESCPDAEIHYTIGTTPAEPTTSDQIFVPFSGPIEITSTQTVKAKVFAERNGNTLSGDTATRYYEINPSVCNKIPGTVTFIPKGTTYNSSLKVELEYYEKNCSTYDILYTISDVGIPPVIENIYSAPIIIANKDKNITARVRVLNSLGTYVYGLPKTEIYTYNKNGCDGTIERPTFNPVGGTYNQPVYLSLSYNNATCSDYNIHYTTNNTEPTTLSPIAGRNKSINISVDKNITAKVFARNSSGIIVSGPSKKENYRITAGGSVLCASGVGGGTGTITDPKIICTPEELNDIRFGANLGKYYVLGQDIDLNHSILSNLDLSWGYSSTYGWTPIGLQTNVFTGSLDGNGYKIKNLYINRPTNYNGEYLGLFGYLGGTNPTIKNLELVNANITGYGYVGGLVGVSPNNVNSIIDNITVTNIKLNSNNLSAGGIIGANYRGVLQNSTSTGNITGVMVVGGLVGSTGQYSSIINSNSSASVSGTETIGGLVGIAGGSILNSYFEGDVSGDEYIGGISGSLSTGNINNSYFSGTVTGNTVVGGISGNANQTAKIMSSYCTNIASINGQTKIGGIVGNISLGQSTFSIIEDSNFNGTVTGISEIGGILGYGKATQSGSYSRTIINSNLLNGTITGDSNVGGIVGYSNQTNIEGCKSNGNIVGKNNVGGITGQSSSQLISNSSFSGTITSSGSGNNFGGIAGFNQSSYLFNNYSKGNVTAGSNVNNVGGLVGQCKYAASNIYNNYSVSPVTGGNNVGGFIGYSENCVVQKNYSTGAVTGTTNAGGFIGSISAGFYNFNYWNTQTSGKTTSATGTGKTTAEMKQQATFVGFNFNPGDNLWNINAGSTYPYLRQNTQMPLPN